MSSELGDFFSLIGEEKKKKEEKKKELIGEVSLSDLFSSLSEEKKKEKEKKLKKEQEIEKIKKDAKIFENLFFSQPKPVDTTDWKDDYKPIEIETEDIVTPEPLEPTEGIGSEIVSQEEPKEESTIEKSLEILEQMIPEEEQLNESETEMARMKREVDQLRKMLYETIQKVEVQGGGGEVRLEFLDDVDRDSIKQNNKFIKYDASTKSFVGADASGGSVDLGPLTNIAAASSGSIPQGATLSFDAASGQFITTTAIGAATTNIGGYPITDANPQDNNVITFNSDTGVWEYDSPFTIVDLSDGVQDGHQDYGSFN